MKAGVYQPDKFRDVPYKQYVIRGFVAVERIGSGVLFDEPKLDSVTAVEGDPDVRAVDGGKSRVGLGPIAGCEGLL